MTQSSSTRLNKYISESGICSRREADRYIEQGNVRINGKRASVGDQVLPTDTVMVNGQIIEPRAEEDQVFIALNKPVGVVSTTDSAERDNIQRFVGHTVRIFPIGRLDKDSQGLIFMTSNGDLVNKILRAGNNHEKEYLVTVDKPITKTFIDGMAGGVPILGTVTKKCRVSQESRFVFRIVLVQGLNRQIRRMAEHFGFDVTRLERQRIMNISLGNLPVGQWRDLTSKELAVLMDSIRDSSSDAPAAPQKPTGKTKPTTAPAQKRESHKPRSSNKSPARPATKSAGKPGGRPDNRAGAKPAARPKPKPKKQRQRSPKR
ncbi:23S rRNA pseudouridine(2604) synthase RluF [Marinobacter sp. M3C]|jgi:23S rRNA pseudouridine2604 synthase|uniref:23S rRNA pseudouridine(2604) synthase RluF n=1 Tax=unclassified Marinobacter TaxID=83889 RepID=UPI00200C988D|nr:MULTISPECIES: 23S rRNA pseudouridine(2604) synthase RluF [unclassified Marinobacter]MCL1479447.1 23S rRNA pseudouridine(2604) synthase RluF [Marinobacter sp.]MCL1482122.1 23S rRNA pseudouridine(2604) synthase RluF [Marinobacter sp.]MCL1483151.1 23S rRNA pseudouridine(2604) synthase RluF [Marinobacter sp.]MCL1488567.1 23S rRNA pseudouridine(2604) synthase RluF [Marinobacter sp.]UQG54588.1 23S rRNA pseudouridine(2604) synthase RluF [Marinobacter sp. M4C]